MSTVQELYEKEVKPLHVVERLELMQLIMQELTASAPRWIVETSDMWSEEDLHDLSRASLLHASQRFVDEELDV
jgi:hypothetical protein